MKKTIILEFDRKEIDEALDKIVPMPYRLKESVFVYKNSKVVGVQVAVETFENEEEQE